jgi:SAM-dependent methyltransferase
VPHSPSLVVPQLQPQAQSSVVLEQVACPLCGSVSFEPVLRGRDVSGPAFQVVRCMRCGLACTNPRPTAATIGHFYPTDYRPHSGLVHADRPLRGWYPLDWLRSPGEQRPRLLDFGCGGGHFLAAMHRAGWDVVGLDVSEAAAHSVRNDLGLPALAGSLPHAGLEPESFDLVTMWHSLEHVHEPRRTLGEARKLLRPGGRLVVAVPNTDGWPARWFGADWYGLDVPRHLTHFGPATLRRMLEVCDFRVVALRHPRHADWLRTSARRARFSPFRSLLRSRPLAAVAARLCQIARRSDVVMAFTLRD